LAASVLSFATAVAQTRNTVSVTRAGWTVTADGEQQILSIAHDNWGTVTKDARLSLEGAHGLQPLRKWLVERQGESRLSIKTGQPRTAWLLELLPMALKISSTSTQAVLTAEIPASADRIVARLVDPQGVPVTWGVGTGEIAPYGGSGARTWSYLPQQNPEVMYFSLGQVSSSNFHSLFDRKFDTAVEFSDRTFMQRNRLDADLLDVTIPVPGNTLVRFLPEYYTATLGLPYYTPFDDSYFSKPPSIWSSWTSYYEEVTEKDMVRNADWIATHLKPYGFQYVELDDGYDRGKNGEHYWVEKWDQKKFPHGPKWLADYIKSEGLHPGLWLVPNAYAGAVDQHPDW